MKAAIALGARLAVGTGGQRGRSLAVGAASALGTAFILTVFGIAADQLIGNTAFERRAIVYFIAGANLIVALPVLALLTTVGRLSASMRDRRLANLRLLGMTAAQTRAVAAAETGIVSAMGACVGGLAHTIVVATAAPVALAPVGAWIVVLLAVPTAVILVAASPQRGTSRSSLGHARRSMPDAPQWWRGLVLLVGLALCGLAHQTIGDTPSLHLPQIAVLSTLFAGVAIVGLGIVVVVPIFTQLIAATMLRFGRGPRATLLGRRLQDQPAAMSRVVATLMVGLFTVMMARAVLSAFLATPQYLAAADHIERDQIVEVSVPAAQAATMRAQIADAATVEEIHEFPIAAISWGDYEEGEGGTALIAHCHDLIINGHPIEPCSDTRANPISDLTYGINPSISAADLRAFNVNNMPIGMTVSVPIDFSAASISIDTFGQAVGLFNGHNVVVVSPDLPGVADLLPDTKTLLIIHGGPGDHLYHQLQSAGIRADSSVDFENYRFVQGMQRLIWTVAVTVLCLGLLAFTVAAVDRGVARRRELTALRLLGTPDSLLRWTQWLEALVPTALGSLLALGCGAYAGSAYLQLDEQLAFPLRPAALLCGAALVISGVLAVIVMIGTASRVDPEHIRTQ